MPRLPNPPVHVRYVGEAQVVIWRDGETYAGRVETLDGTAWEFSGLMLPDDLAAMGETDHVVDKIVEVAVSVASSPRWNREGTAGEIAQATTAMLGGRRRRAGVSSAPPRQWLELSTDPSRNPRSFTERGERVYEHVKRSYSGDPRAKEIASRTVYARSRGGAKGLVKKNPRRRSMLYGQDPVITLDDLIEQLELWNDNTDGSQGGEDVWVAVYDEGPREDREWTIHQFFSQRELEAHKKKYGGKYAKVRIPGHNKPFNAHRVAVQAFQELGIRILNPNCVRP